MRYLIVFICLAVAILGISSQASPQRTRKIALVVGNRAYKSLPPTGSTENDARLMAQTLKTLGFEIVGGQAYLNLTKHDFENVLADFGQKLTGADIAFFYYAGHGVQVDGTNYLIPTDADVNSRRDLFRLVSVDVVLSEMNASSVPLKILALDACRNNPLGIANDLGSLGLHKMRPPEGTIISFSAEAGQFAQDDPVLSPYTKALAATISLPGVDVFQVFNLVGVAVEDATQELQTPEFDSRPIRGELPSLAPVNQITEATPAAVALSTQRPIVEPIGRAGSCTHYITVPTDVADGVPIEAVSLVERFEGFSRVALQDGIGVWSIGYGTVVYPNGKAVERGDCVDKLAGALLLGHDVAKIEPALARSIPYWSEMNDSQRSALLSFGYNVGIDFYGKSEFGKISSVLRDRRWDDVPSALQAYTQPNEPVIHAGLLQRRIAEGDVWKGKNAPVPTSL